MADLNEPTQRSALDYLDHARPVAGANRFAVGTFERNITLYRQQMRALNLVYAMRIAADTNPADCKFDRIAVVGGGAFGTTAAAAAATIGIEAYLYEQHQILLPFQRGCDTRWVNPRYYEWPAAGAETPHASLPILNWKSGTASEVADQLAAELEAIRNNSKRIVLRMRARDLQITDVAGIGDALSTVRVACRYDSNEQETMAFDAVIYATGFGVEHDLDSRTVPYWRNDNLGQLDLTVLHKAARRYLISGVGDGGLTDVARLRIADFHHERLFFELFGDMSDSLRTSLQGLATRAPDEGLAPNWLYEQLNMLASPDPYAGPFSTALERLKARLRKDTEVELNGLAGDFSEALSLRKVSFSNALLSFLLHRIGAFTYLSGRLVRDGKRWTRAGDEAWKAPSHVVIRHGTSRDATLETMGFGAAIQPLKDRAETLATAQRLFPPGWWAKNKSPPKGVQVAEAVQAAEFAPPTTVTVATTFISTLSDVLIALLKDRDPAADGRASNPHIRMTLHRVTRIGDEEVFQQISPYRGLLLERQKGGAGRVFPIGPGMVGLALRIGRPIVFRRNAPQLTAMESVTDFAKLLAQPIEDHVDSMLACPFFAADDGSGERRVNFVLFADTSDLRFFNDANLKLVYAACRGLVDNIDASLDEQRLRQISSSYPGHRVEAHLDPSEEARFNEVGITFDDAVFAQFRRDLTFKLLRSTELDDGLSSFR